MSKRLLQIAALILILVPAAAIADDVAPSQEPTTSASTAVTSDASLLGPPSAAAGGSSLNTGSTLQPGGSTALQSTTSDSTGLTSTNSNTLQGSAPSGDLKIMLDTESDGERQMIATTSEDGSQLGPLWLVPVILVVVAGGLWLLRRRTIRRFSI